MAHSPTKMIMLFYLILSKYGFHVICWTIFIVRHQLSKIYIHGTKQGRKTRSILINISLKPDHAFICQKMSFSVMFCTPTTNESLIKSQQEASNIK